MNITILGAGAIGSLWAYKLSQAGHNVSVWTKDADQTEIVVQLDEKHPLHFTANNPVLLQNCDLLLITVKAWQVQIALLPILEQVNSDTILVFMHNGMGAVDEIAQQIKRFPAVLATTTQAAYKPDPQHVMHTGAGTTQLGPFNQAGKQCSFLAQVLAHALPEVSWNDNINTALWNKLAINCAINPLTAIHQIKNGQLAGHDFQQVLAQVTTEVATVMQAEGIDTQAGKLLQLVYTVIEATAANQSSMQQDIGHQRPSEIDYITGYLCRCAQRHQLAVPANLALYKQIKQIEQSWQ